MCINACLTWCHSNHLTGIGCCTRFGLVLLLLMSLLAVRDYYGGGERLKERRKQGVARLKWGARELNVYTLCVDAGDRVG